MIPSPPANAVKEGRLSESVGILDGIPLTKSLGDSSIEKAKRNALLRQARSDASESSMIASPPSFEEASRKEGSASSSAPNAKSSKLPKPPKAPGQDPLSLSCASFASNDSDPNAWSVRDLPGCEFIPGSVGKPRGAFLKEHSPNMKFPAPPAASSSAALLLAAGGAGNGAAGATSSAAAAASSSAAAVGASSSAPPAQMPGTDGAKKTSSKKRTKNEIPAIAKEEVGGVGGTGSGVEGDHGHREDGAAVEEEKPSKKRKISSKKEQAAASQRGGSSMKKAVMKKSSKK